MRTHIEKGTVTARRVTKVIKMIVVEYGGKDRGRGSACARSRNPSERPCMTDIFRRETFTGICRNGTRLWMGLSRVLVANIESTFSPTFDASAARHLRSFTCYSRQFCGQVSELSETQTQRQARVGAAKDFRAANASQDSESYNAHGSRIMNCVE